VVLVKLADKTRKILRALQSNWKGYQASKRGILANLDSWGGSRVNFGRTDIDVKDALWTRILLIENKTTTGGAEERLYESLVLSKKSKIFGHKRLYRIRLNDRPQALTGPTVDDLTRVVERFTVSSRKILREFGFLISVNPTDSWGTALRSLAPQARLISVITDDGVDGFDEAVIAESDCVVVTANAASRLPMLGKARRLDIAPTADRILSVIEGAIVDLRPKEFNVLLPVFNCFERLPILDDIDTDETDVVIWLKCSQEETPVISSTFSEFLDRLSPYIGRVAATDEMRERYPNLLREVAAARNTLPFLSRALQDGARLKVIHE